jgi:hypothetical protein
MPLHVVGWDARSAKCYDEIGFSVPLLVFVRSLGEN